MADIRDVMRLVDARIYQSAIVRAVCTFGSHTLVGAFFRDPRELSIAGGNVMGIGTSFECQYVAAIAQLAEHDHVEIEGYGEFRFLRELLPGGDESGQTVIELGTIK